MIDTARNIMGGKVAFPQELSQGAVDFITACLRKHPGDRPTVMEMLRLPWINIHKVRRHKNTPFLSPPVHQRILSAYSAHAPSSWEIRCIVHAKL